MLSKQRACALPRREILRGKSTISSLFNEGARLKGGPFLMLYTCSRQGDRNGCTPVRVLFTVGKKLVPRAVDRNRIKRLMREAYRLEKKALSGLIVSEGDGASYQVLLAFLYRGRTNNVPPLVEFRTEIRRMLNTMVSKGLAQPQDGGRIEHNE
ncbi:MAG TPA: ribonuclease P protein component [Chlorobaculum parvum]|uniref:Ribonuclease P protein component n=1 Tax=Chlorobaculum parvum TaxID=274539 RepID=A0A7C5HQW9_9CHLB|nr:ribonuclease P protein component [Chlorobaculum parvum]